MPPPKWGKALTLITTSLMTLSAGTLYGFSAYSKDLVVALGRTGDLDILGSFGDAGLYAGLTMGLLTDKCGTLVALLVSSVFTFVGYGIVWLATAHYVTLDVPILAIGFLLAGQGSFGFYFNSVHLNGDLFSQEYRSAVYGYVLMLFGFSSLVYLSIFTGALNSDVTSFFLLLTTSLPAVGLLSASSQLLIRVCGSSTEKSQALRADGVSEDESSEVEEADIDVGRPLLPSHTKSITGLQLFKSSLFWWLFIYFVCMTGPGLMWKNKIGTIISTFPDAADTNSVVKSWAVINSLSRVIFGIIGATVGRWNFPKAGMLIFAAVLMGGSHLLYAILAYSENADLPFGPLWIANVCTAIAYGCQFTVVTALVPAYFGTEGLGMNIGIVTIAPMIGGTALTAVVKALPDDHYAAGFMCSASLSGVALLCAAVLTRHDIKAAREPSLESL